MCLCDNYTNKLTCYNNCMSSQDRAPVQNQVTQFCLAAEPYVPRHTTPSLQHRLMLEAQP